MNNRSGKLLWIGLGIAIVLGLVWQFYPLADAQDRVTHLPREGYNIIGEDLPISQDMKDFFGDAYLLRRAYEVNGQRIVVWVIDGTHNRHAVHDPLYCIRGGGWNVESQTPLPITGGTADVIRQTKDGRATESLVWFSDGKTRHASAPRYWWQTTLRRLTLGISGPEPVLINVSPYSTNSVDWHRLADEFPGLFEL
ncbi:MAG TPA: hypothetical protein VH255_09995 [Verrucomicrobiae bacterium]|nr:hypothetical protein [Verrucomicrobiae bacterium]